MPDKLSIIQTEPLYRFLTWNRHHWTSLVSVVIAGSLAALAASLIPLVTGQLFTHILPGGNRQLLQYLPLVLAALLLMMAAAGQAGYYALHRLYGRFTLDIRTEMFQKLLTLPPACPDLSATTITTCFFQSMEKLLPNAILIGTSLFRDLLTVIGLFVVMICLNQEISVLVLVMLTAALLIGQLSRGSASQQSILGQKQSEVSGMIHKTLQHHRAIHLDQSHTQEIRHVQHTFEQLQLASVKQLGNIKLTELLIFIFLTSMFTISLYYLLQQITLNKLTAGNTAAFFTATLMLAYPLKRLSGIRASLKECSETLYAIFSLLDRQAEPLPEKLPSPRTRYSSGRLRFEKVSFPHSQPESRFPPVDLEIPPGMKIALTHPDIRVNRMLADLACGLIRPATGRILLDGQDINQISNTDLYDNIAWVIPDKGLLDDTVAANIAYGSRRCSTETAIIAAAHASHAIEFICSMPHGLQTRTDNPTVTLSDEQRQRILIARALLKNPAIVILDETTACFDTDDPLLLQALHTLVRNRTVLILSSRPVMLNLAGYLFDPGQPGQITCANPNKHETDG